MTEIYAPVAPGWQLVLDQSPKRGQSPKPALTPGRVFLRRPLRPPAAGHRQRHVRAVSQVDPPGLFRHQARLVPGQPALRDGRQRGGVHHRRHRVRGGAGSMFLNLRLTIRKVENQHSNTIFKGSCFLGSCLGGVWNRLAIRKQSVKNCLSSLRELNESAT